MLSTDNQKQCSRCEEFIHPQSTSCPYCGTDLSSNKVVRPASSTPFSAPLTPLAPPEQPAIPRSPYNPSPTTSTPSTTTDSTTTSSTTLPPPVEKRPASPYDYSIRTILTPLLLLLSGTVFFLFGLVLSLYSKEGVFTLHWKSAYWPLYLAVAASSLFYGWRALHRLEEYEEHSSNPSNSKDS